MSGDSSTRVADLAAQVAEGRRNSDELLLLVYDELRNAARRQLGQLNPGNTFQPTSLVHEAYVRLIGKDLTWHGARHFYFAAARAMHDILVERARAKASQKRGGGRHRLDLDKLTVAYEAPDAEMLALSEALRELEKHQPRKHQIVMLRFFGGLTCDECATAIDLSQRSVERDWRFARAWLHKRLCEMGEGGDDDD